MNREGQRLQTLQQRRRGSVKEFVANAEHAARKRRRGLLPAAVRYDFLQRDSISRSAPCSDHHLRIELPNFLSGKLPAWSAEELASSGLDQFRDPPL